MKNRILAARWVSLLVLIAGIQSAFGLSYLWSRGTTTYTPITGTSVTFSATDNAFNYFYLPFNFTYDSIAYSYVYVTTNGLLGFSTTSLNSIGNPDLFTSNSPVNVIAPWWDDLIDDDSSSVQWLASGVAPNRVVTIQYSGFPSYVTAPRSRIHFQVKLFETSNQIQFVYGDQINPGNSNPLSSASIGLKGRTTGPLSFIEGTTGSRIAGISNLNSAADFPVPNSYIAFGPDTLAPQGLQATAGNGNAALLWSQTRLSPFLRYRIYAGTTPNNLILHDSTASLTNPTLTVTGLNNGTLYYFAVTAVNTSGLESNFSNVVSATPTTPPTVTLTAPSQGATVRASAALLLTAAASDVDGTVSRVEYYQGATLIGTSYTISTWQYTWYPSIVGNNSITARAYDNTGASTISAPVTIQVVSPPTVYLSTPAANIYPAGNPILVTAVAGQSGGSLTRVEFFDGAVKIGESISGPYTLNWVGASPGRHTLTAVATNNYGFSTTSSAITIGVGQIPTVTLTTPSDGAYLPLNGSVTMTATLQDPDGLAYRVVFYVDGSTWGTVYSPGPYSIAWTPSTVGSHQLIARLYDFQGFERSADTSNVMVSNGPVVRLTTPSHFTAYTTGATIHMAATATATGGSISEVRFYRDSVLLGTDVSLPYAFSWPNAPVGRYRIQARAVDASGTIGYSQAVTVFVNDSGVVLPGGRLVVTGHDADDHRNYNFMSKCLDYLFFGRIPTSSEIPIRKGARIAFLATNTFVWPSIVDYPAPTSINPLLPKWDSLLFRDGHYDAILIGTGMDYLSRPGSDSVNTRRALFDQYFNRGGTLFALSEQGIGQTYYNFLPAFGSARQQSIGSVSGQFTVTPAGLNIGLTSANVNTDETHTEFVNVDTLFQIFETYNRDTLPVTIGASAIIEEGGFIPIDSVVAAPTAAARDTLFDDTLCIRFSSATLDAILHLTTDGGNPDTSSRTIVNGAMTCIDRSTTFRVIGKKTGWQPSREVTFSYRRLGQVIAPLPDVTHPYFQDSICVAFTSATPGAEIRYTLNGNNPDSTSASKPNGGAICLVQSGTIKVIGVKSGMIPSDAGSYRYDKMERVANPFLNVSDTVYFPDSLCVTFGDSTPGAHILYTLDGGVPDTSERHAHDGDRRCFDRTTQVRLIATKLNWVSSERVVYTLIQRRDVAPPIANRTDSTYFVDTLCVKFSSATDSSAIRYELNRGLPDTSSPQIPNHQGFCVDHTVDIQAQATRVDWNPSAVTHTRFFKMDTVAQVRADPGDSTYFSGSLCIVLSSVTSGIQIEGRLTSSNGTKRDFIKAEGDTVCVEDSATLQVRGVKTHWVSGPPSTYRYFPRQKAGMPVADQKDSIYFADSLCVRFTSPTPGVQIQYSVEGAPKDSAERSMPNGGQICTDTTVRVHAIASGPQWLPSDTVYHHAFRMSDLSPPESRPGDSTYFPDSLCIRWTHAIPGVDIRLASGSQKLDSAASRLRSGDSVCIDQSSVFHARAEKNHWNSSPAIDRHYFRMVKLDAPEFDRGDTVFYPTVCLELRHSNRSVELHYTVDGGNPDTSKQIKYSGDTVCVSRTADIRVVAKQKNAIDSKPVAIHLERMKQVADIRSSRGDSLMFAGKLCFTLKSETEGSRIAYTLDGGNPSVSGLTMASGDSICVTNSVEIRAVGIKPQWRDSDTSRFVYRVDNDGPDILKAEKRPFQIGNLSITGNCRGSGQDTLILTLSEKLKAVSRPPRWEKMALFSPRCDRASTYPVPVMAKPVVSEDSLKVAFLFDNGISAEVPQSGHCVYLDSKSKEFTDAVGNAPDSVGAKVEENSKTVRISRLRAYPPVVGLDETPASRGCADEKTEANTWIPPFGFDPGSGTVNFSEAQSCGGNRSEGEVGPSKMPECLSVLEVVSNGGYVADIKIFDQFGTFVNSSRQIFGHCGELENLNRSEKGKSRSYLVWNSRDKSGARVGTGAYLWRIEFKSDSSKPGQTRTVVLRTGFIRTEQCMQ